MLKITELVKDGILEISFHDPSIQNKNYVIKTMNGNIVSSGKIAGSTQRTCLYIGELKKGEYHFHLGESDALLFKIV